MQVEPAVFKVTLPLRRGERTLTAAALTETRWPMMSEFSFSCPALALPAGRWLIVTHASAPGGRCGPASEQSDTTLASSGMISVPTLEFDVFRHLDGEKTPVTAAVDVHRWRNDRWMSYARARTEVVLPPAPPATAADRYGSVVHLLLDPVSGAVVPAGLPTQMVPYLNVLDAAGGDIVRTAGTWWYMMPTTSGVLDTTLANNLDTFFADCASRGIDIILEIGSPPAYTGGLTATTPTNAHIDAFVDTVLARWTPYAIEFNNEPNNEPEQPAAHVTRVVNRMYTRAQLAGTPPLVGGVGLAGADAGYLQEMYDAGLTVDYVSVHNYQVHLSGDGIGDPRHPFARDEILTGWVQGATSIYRTMRANGDGDKPIWMTEGGWASCRYNPTVGLRCSEAQQADYWTVALRQLARCPFVEVVMPYATYDGKNARTAWAGWGMSRIGAQRKPAFDAFKNTVAGIKAGTL